MTVSHAHIARQEQDEGNKGNEGARFVVRMPDVIRDINMVFLEITRHGGVVETAVLSRQAIIDHPLFVQKPTGDRG